MFDPGANRQYGYSADWSGRLVEVISGLTLEQYFQRNILEPLGMKDTSFLQPEEKFDRLVGQYNKLPDGRMQGVPRVQPPPTQAFNGGGGLFSTAPDYVRFMQMFLRYGMAGVTGEILKGRTLQMMAENQIGGLTAGKLKTYQPNVSADVDTDPGGADKWGLGFAINPTRLEGRRSAGSLTWAGIFNTYFWIDPRRRIGGVIMMQYLPFFDPAAIALLGEFERAVYATI
jgi:CubicO group peptidase (beta-lactamase class C family)